MYVDFYEDSPSALRVCVRDCVCWRVRVYVSRRVYVSAWLRLRGLYLDV
jgi:hypothetical protein